MSLITVHGPARNFPEPQHAGKERNMKKAIKFLIIVLCLVLIMPPNSASAASYKAGDIVSYGSYPQTRVTDSSLIASLDSIVAGNSGWTSYSYCANNTGPNASEYPAAYDITMMSYCDFSSGGVKYRAVKISKYRPVATNLDPDGQSGQSLNSLPKNTYLYYKWEPINWIVLDPSSGLVISEKILDSQPFCALYKILSNGTAQNIEAAVSVNNWHHSTLRCWMNSLQSDSYSTAYSYDGFLNRAFTQGERNNISSMIPGYGSVGDKIWLLSKSQFDTYKSYLTATASTGYAQSQGIPSGAKIWRLGTPGTNTAQTTTYIASNGNAIDSNVDYSDCKSTLCGVRPAMCVDLTKVTLVTPVVTDVTLNFNANGGSGAPSSITHATGSFTIPTTVPTNFPKAFKGWASSASATEAEYSPGSSVTLSANKTLYAVWKDPINQILTNNYLLQINNSYTNASYKFVPAYEGTYTFRTGSIYDSSKDFEITIYSASGTQLAYNDNEESGKYNFAVSLDLEANQTVYAMIKMKGSQTGSNSLYSVNVAPPVITSQPRDAIRVNVGGSGSFKVEAFGSKT